MTVVAVLALVPATPATAQDVDGSADHPLISRYEGSRILGYRASTFDAYDITVGPADNGDPTESPLQVEGGVTRILYVAPDGRTPLEVFRNYQRALAAEGLEPLFICEEEACGRLFSWIAHDGPDLYEYTIQKGHSRGFRYMAGRLAREDSEVYLALSAATHTSPHGFLEGRTIYEIDVIEVERMEEAMVAVDAAAMGTDIAGEGRAVLYGIRFATDAAEILPESRATLAEVARLLAIRPDLNLHVVGHTDAVGTLDHNLDLSRRRAAAVRNALITEHGIAPGRLVANGVGPLAPVAPNASADGRARNRRVELVPAGG